MRAGHKPWGDTDRDQLKALKKKGNTHADIGRIMGRTRNSISGMVDRMNMSEKRKWQIMNSWQIKPPAPYTRTGKIKIAISTAYGDAKGLEQLQAGECRFPVVGDAKNVFCGAKIEQGSYCQPHYDVCHTITKKRNSKTRR